MRKILHLWLSVIIVLGTTAAAVASDENNDSLIEVIATGIGQDSEHALKNAFRSAIEQVVGTLVDSETLAQNDEIVNDKILSYSSGFVKSHKMIGEPKTQDGLVVIKIQAQVKSTQLSKGLQAANIHTKEVDGESLFGEVLTQLEQRKSGAEFIAKAFEGFPENLLTIEVAGKPSYDGDEQALKVPVAIQLDRSKYGDFAKNLITILNEMALKHKTLNLKHRRVPRHRGSDATSTLLFYSSELEFQLTGGFTRKGYCVLICKSVNDSITNGVWELYEIDKDAYAAISTVFPEFSVEIMDNSGDIVVAKTFRGPMVTGIMPNAGIHAKAILPLVFDNNDSSGMIGRSSSSYELYPGTPVIQYQVQFDVSPNEVKRMRNIVCSVRSGERGQ